ncbi:MAG: ABC transporter permease subunit [Chloroflexi bacterium]|nr:ABC transporter permease subunit [Chloroflexota bacterium]
MRNTLAILKKEVVGYFTSPMAYVVAAVFLVLSGLFFARYVSSAQIASLRGFFQPASFLMILLAPVLTMRLLAEEQKLGTLELLLTAPVRDVEVVLGKFLASLAILAVMLVLTLYYPLLLFWFGDPDPGPLLTGYLSLLLLGASALAVGLLASSLTSNQIVAAVLGLGILLLFWLLGLSASMVENLPLVRDALIYISLGGHLTDLVNGVIDTKDLVYYLSFAAVALFLTVRSLETRRWR